MKAGGISGGAAIPDTGAEMPAELVSTIGPTAIAPDDLVSSGPAFLNPGGFASAACDEDGVVQV